MGLAAVMATALWLVTLVSPPPVIGPADAGRFEGQEVVVSGTVKNPSPWGEGLRFDLVDNGHGLSVLLRGFVDLGSDPTADGASVLVRGDLGRFDGRLVLWAEEILDG